VERGHHGVTTFVAEARIVSGDITLGESAAHHAHVRRLGVGDRVAITDGRGSRGTGQISMLSKTQIVATVREVVTVTPPAAIHLFLPVADRDRMLWLAEKAAELQVASWNPVMFRRSMSVSPRGDGEAFERKVRVRMAQAVEQSGGAWLPTIEAARDVAALPARTGDTSFLLNHGGPTLGGGRVQAPVSLIIGPEGGFEADELAALQGTGWTIASLGDVTLRFETAAVAAVAIARALLTPERGG